MNKKIQTLLSKKFTIQTVKQGLARMDASHFCHLVGWFWFSQPGAKKDHVKMQRHLLSLEFHRI